jgi:hypothetical protein
MAKADITLEYAHTRLEYDTDTGEFFWKRKPAGHKRTTGYVSVHLADVEVKAHQLAWFMHYGKWPTGMIDHINGNPSDNRIENLRDVTALVNNQNVRKASINSKSKMLGACWNKASHKWQVQITDDSGKRHYLGLFDSPEEAHAVFIDAKRRLHEGCTI